jgi:hypothetical protein
MLTIHTLTYNKQIEFHNMLLAPIRIDRSSTPANSQPQVQIPAHSIRFIDSHLTEAPAAKQPRVEDDNNEGSGTQQEPPEIEERPREFEQLHALLEGGTTQFGNGTIKTQMWNPSETCTSLPEFLLAFEGVASRFVSRKVQSRPLSSKVLIDVNIEYAKLVGDKLEATVKAVLRSTAIAVTPGQDADQIASKLCDIIWQRNQNFISQKSGLVVFQVH